jgi:hypothetical protein
MISSPLADVSSEAAFTRSSDGLGASATSVEQSDTIAPLDAQQAAQMTVSCSLTLEAELVEVAPGQKGGGGTGSGGGGREACSAEERHGVRRGSHC